MLCVIRGGGDLATGVAWRLSRAGVDIVVTELAEPLTVRRPVALSTAVTDGTVVVDTIVGRRAETIDDALAIARSPDPSEVAVIVSESLPGIDADVVVDARLAKRNLDTTIDDAPLVVALGPGFTAGVDCDVVVETMRGPHLGRALWSGQAAPNTGTPGVIGGQGAERVLRAPCAGTVRWAAGIGDIVVSGDVLGAVDGVPIVAPFDGIVRGLIAPGRHVPAQRKIGDVDPRSDPTLCHQISDKALAIGGGVAEAVQWWSLPSR